jgi:YfiH family protein
VLENRRRAAQHLGFAAENLATPYQVHGTEVVAVRAAWAPGEGPKADALVTRTPGILLGVGAADCGPVLFADPVAKVVGAAHAGWKGALSGVLEAAIEGMTRMGAHPNNIVAVLGPTISARAYEVGPEFVTRFMDAGADNRSFFRPSERDGHAYFDLPGYILYRLKRAGISQAYSAGFCTYCDEEKFFSYRRATHRGEPDYGRNLSAIGLIETSPG